MVIALPDLVLLAILLFAFAVAYSLKTLVQGLIDLVHKIVGGIPLIGRVFDSGFKAAMQPLADAAGVMVHWCDAAIGTSFHVMAQLLNWTRNELVSLALEPLTLAKQIEHLLSRKHFVTIYKTVTQTIRAAGHAADQALHKTTVIVKPVERLVGHGVLPRLRAVEYELGGVIAHDIPGLRAREKALADHVNALFRRLKGDAKPLVGAAAIALVAAVLSRLGLNFIRCANVRSVGKRVCGMDTNLLEALLADTLAIVGTVSLIEFIKDAQAIETAALDGLAGFIREMPGG